MKQCPDNEIISAYYDGELDGESPEALHISSCPECAKILESYADMDKALKNKFTCEIPANLTEKVKKTIHRRINAEKRISIPFPVLLLRIAASLFIASVILFYVSSLVKDREIKTAATSKHEIRKNVSGGLGIIPFEDYVKASFRAPPVSTPLLTAPDTANRTGKIEKSAALPDKVSQVWVTRNIEKLPSLISTLTAKAGISSENTNITINDGNTANLDMKLSKGQLFNFVRLCKNSGFELLSPHAPQPEQKVQQGTENEDVNYNASFVLGHN